MNNFDKQNMLADFSSWRGWAVLIVVFFGLYVFPAYVAPLFDMDEGVYAAVSREMYLSGHWWQTVFNSEPFFHKPVWMYWMQSLGLWLTGEGRFAYRLSSLVAFALWLWASFGFAKRALDRDTAVFLLWISLFVTGVTVVFKAAIPDAWLILFISLACYRSYDYLHTLKGKYLFWAFVWTGFGILTKGPVAFIIVAGSLFFYLGLTKQWALLGKTILYWRGWLAMLAVALPWYVLQYALYGQAFIDEFFGVHNVGRFTKAMEGHSGNSTYYIGALLFLSLPFFPLLMRGLKNWWRWAQASEVENKLLWRFWGIWFLLVFVFFTISATKLPHYLMYGMPPVFFAMAYAAKSFGTRWGLGLTILLLAAVFAAVPWAITDGMANEKNLYAKETFGAAFELAPTSYYALMGIMAAAGLVILVKKMHALNQVVIAGAAMALVVNFGVLKFAAFLQQKPVVEAANFAKKTHLKVDTGAFLLPSFNVEAQQISPITDPQSGHVVFGKRAKLAEKYQDVEWLWQGRGVAIVRLK